jgi:thiol-disulfide isomerase/thioredoxin
MSDSTVPATLQVACLCAEWCGTCREYGQAYAALQASYPEASFHWLDVEDEADLLGDLDVENFPTLLIGVAGQPVFFGVLLPHIQTLERLVQDAPGLRPLSESADSATLRALLAGLAQRQS